MEAATPGAYVCTACASAPGREKTWTLRVKGTSAIYEEQIQAVDGDSLFYMRSHDSLCQSIEDVVKTLLRANGEEQAIRTVHPFRPPPRDSGPGPSAHDSTQHPPARARDRLFERNYVCPLCSRVFTDLKEAEIHSSSCQGLEAVEQPPPPPVTPTPGQGSSDGRLVPPSPSGPHSSSSSFTQPNPGTPPTVVAGPTTQHTPHPTDGGGALSQPCIINTCTPTLVLWLHDKEGNEDRLKQAEERCQMEGNHFVDTEFPPSARSISNTLRSPQEIRWIRLLDLGRVQGQLVVYDRPAPVDVVQGQLGNCWFMSALSVLAERQDLVRNLFFTKEASRFGVYQVRLCKDGEWTVVMIDDHVPCDANERLLYSSFARREIWVPLVEKAMAKLHGSYKSLSAGSMCEGFSTLTGAPCITLHLQNARSSRNHDDAGAEAAQEEEADMWTRVSSCFDASYLMGASIDSTEDPAAKRQYDQAGLMMGHAYSILDVRQVEQHRLVKFRNPTASMSWRGDWADSSYRWTPALKERLRPGGNRHGIFWMAWRDVCRYFTAIDICKVRDDWFEARAVGLFPATTTDTTTGLLVTLEERLILQLTLYQSGLRASTDFYETQDMGLMVLKLPSASCRDLTQATFVVGTNRAIDTRHCCETSPLSPGTYVIVPYSLNSLHSGAPSRRFILSVHSANHVAFEPLAVSAVDYGQCLVRLIRKYGKKQQVSDNIWFYNYESMLAVVNAHPEQHVTCEITAEGIANMVCSRQIMFVQTSTSPLCQQLVACYTAKVAEHSSSISFRFNFHTRLDRGEDIPPTLPDDMHHQQWIPGIQAHAYGGYGQPAQLYPRPEMMATPQPHHQPQPQPPPRGPPSSCSPQ